MRVLSPWRQELKGLIPRGFVRLSLGQGLLVSDYPRFPGAQQVEEGLRAAGYEVTVAGGLAYLDGCRAKYEALLSALPEVALPPPQEGSLYAWGLAHRLLKGHTPLSRQPLPPIRETIKWLELGEWARLLRRLPPLLALGQRRGEASPTAVGRLLALALQEQLAQRR